MQKFDWHVLKSEYLVQNEWVSLRADTCQMPTGVLIDPYYILESPSFVNVVPVTPAGEVVMVRLYRHGSRQTALETPGGIIDAGESPLTTCRRELLEETGYTSDHLLITGSGYPDPARLDCRAYYGLALDVVPVAAPQRDASEQMEVVLMPLAEVEGMLMHGRIHDAVHQSSLFYALAHLRGGQAG